MQLFDFPVNTYFSVWHLFPPEDENDLFDRPCYPKCSNLPDSLSEPVVEGHVLVNKEASHPALSWPKTVSCPVFILSIWRQVVFVSLLKEEQDLYQRGPGVPQVSTVMGG